MRHWVLAVGLGVVLVLGGAGQLVAAQWKWQDDYLFKAEVCYLPESDMKGDRGRVSVGRVFAEGYVPLSSKGEVLSWGLRPKVEVWSLSWDGLGQRTLANGTNISSADMPSRLWGVDLAGWGTYALSKATYIYAEAGVSVTSDMEDISTDDMSLITLAFAGHSFSPAFELLLGAGYNQALGRGQVYPLLGVRWIFAEGWALDVLLPAHATLRWQFAPGLEAGVEFATQGGDYRLSESRPWCNAIATWQQMTLGPYVQIGVGGLMIRVSAGYSFERKLEIHSDGFNQKLLEYEPDDGVVFALQAYWPI